MYPFFSIAKKPVLWTGVKKKKKRGNHIFSIIDPTYEFVPCSNFLPVSERSGREGVNFVAHFDM